MEDDSGGPIRRNFVFFFIPLILLALSALLLAWAILRVNLSPSMQSKWPWKLQLLDIQSATTATTIAAGLVFARAQFASAVRPMWGWTGRVVEARGFSSKLVWIVRVVNQTSAPANFHSPMYCVYLMPRDPRETGQGQTWISRTEAIEVLNSAGLKYGVDYELRYFGPSFTLSDSRNGSVLGVFARKAMQIVDDVVIQVQVADQSRDTRQISIHCMRGAARNPKGPTIE